MPVPCPASRYRCISRFSGAGPCRRHATLATVPRSTATLRCDRANRRRALAENMPPPPPPPDFPAAGCRFRRGLGRHLASESRRPASYAPLYAAADGSRQPYRRRGPARQHALCPRHCPSFASVRLHPLPAPAPRPPPHRGGAADSAMADSGRSPLGGARITAAHPLRKLSAGAGGGRGGEEREGKGLCCLHLRNRAVAPGHEHAHIVAVEQNLHATAGPISNKPPNGCASGEAAGLARICCFCRKDEDSPVRAWSLDILPPDSLRILSRPEIVKSVSTIPKR